MQFNEDDNQCGGFFFYKYGLLFYGCDAHSKFTTIHD